MKHVFAAALTAIALAPVALADTRSVGIDVPANISDPAAAAAYTQALGQAIDRVCRREANPVIGHGYEVYRVCVRETERSVAKQDPTGLFAGLIKDGRFDVAAN